MSKIVVKDTEINVFKVKDEDYLCLTDMLKAKAGRYGGTYAHNRLLKTAILGYNADIRRRFVFQVIRL